MGKFKYIFRFNNELSEKVLSFYEKEKDLNILSAEFNIKKKNIAEFLKSKHVFIKGQYGGARKYQVNKYFFDNIDSEEKAYFLGLLYADGSNRLVRGEVNLTLQEKDYYLLEKLNNLINPARPIYKLPKKVSTGGEIYRMSINSKYVSNKLNELGVFENKSFKLIFPKWLNEELFSHFIRGYFDGDGSVSVNKNITKLQIQIIGTESFLNDIMEILVKNCNVNHTKLGLNHKNNTNNIRILGYSGNNNAKKIYKYLYKDANIYMLRKKDKFKMIA
jgi:hypothetical protein